MARIPAPDHSAGDPAVPQGLLMEASAKDLRGEGFLDPGRAAGLLAELPGELDVWMPVLARRRPRPGRPPGAPPPRGRAPPFPAFSPRAATASTASSRSSAARPGGATT